MINNKYKLIGWILSGISLFFILLGIIWFGVTSGNVDNQFIKITSDVKEIESGWGYQLEISKSIDSGSTIEYISSDNNILTISNTGYMNALSPGEVTVTVRVKGNNKVSDSIKILIVEPKERLVLSEKTIYLKPNEERKIYVYNTNPEGYLTWETKDDFIATVTEDGVIKGLNYGETEIVVTNENNVSETITVKVLSPEEEETIELQDLYITEQNVGLDVGETLQLTVVFDPREVSDKTLVWNTSNPSAVTVSEDGLITAVGDGNATITAKAYNGLVAKCETTSTTNVIPITGITLSSNDIKLQVGDGYTLKATIAPSNATSKNVRWTSSNTSVAKVNNGVILALKEGSATITATTNNGKTATAKVTITRKVVEPYNITLDKNNVTINVGGKASFSATITPNNADNKSVTWSSSDKNIATVSNGQVTGVKTGTVTITAKTVNGKTATATVKVTDEVINVTSISLNSTSLTLNSGATATLKVTYTPANATNQNVTWSSNNTSVATVTNGVVKGVKGGNAIITAKTSNGKTATCNVEVKQADDEITIRKRTSNYTGSPISASISAKSGTLKSTTYYSNANCTTKTNTSNANAEGGPPKEPGTYYVIAESKGNNTYNGITTSCTEAVTINKKKATITCSNKAYNGKSQVIATCNGGTLQNANQTNVGTYAITCTGTGQFGDATEKNCQITPKSISGATVTGLSDAVYTGNPITPTPIVTITLDTETRRLTNGVDYTYTFKNNVNAGTASVVISGKGNYNGSKTATFQITKEKAIVRCADKTYNGSSQVIASCTGGTPNSAATQVNQGSYSVGCNPDSSHSAPDPITCHINPYSFSNLIVSGLTSKPYTGSAVEPSSFIVQVNLNGQTRTLNKGTDYTYKATNNINVGDAVLTITGKGNYTGTYVTSFAITPIPAIATCTDKTYNGNTQTIATCNCQQCTPQNASQKNVGTYPVTCTGDANHSASTTQYCHINKATDIPEITHKTATSYGQPVYAIVSAQTCSSAGSTQCAVTYYTDSSCQRQTNTTNAVSTGGAPKATGTYYAKATSPGNSNYNSGTSTCTKAITIN